MELEFDIRKYKIHVYEGGSCAEIYDIESSDIDDFMDELMTALNEDKFVKLTTSGGIIRILKCDNISNIDILDEGVIERCKAGVETNQEYIIDDKKEDWGKFK